VEQGRDPIRTADPLIDKTCRRCGVRRRRTSWRR